jgi:hypothetical protein
MVTVMSTTTNYIPGVCNINPQEIRHRQMIGHVGLIITVILFILIFATNAPWYFRLAIFIPAFLSATGYLQARNKFCVGFANAKMQHADDDAEAVAITDKSALKKDKKKAQSINLQSALIAALVVAVVTIL